MTKRLTTEEKKELLEDIYCTTLETLHKDTTAEKPNFKGSAAKTTLLERVRLEITELDKEGKNTDGILHRFIWKK